MAARRVSVTVPVQPPNVRSVSKPKGSYSGVVRSSNKRFKSRYDRMCGDVVVGHVNDREKIAGKIVLDELQRGRHSTSI